MASKRPTRARASAASPDSTSSTSRSGSRLSASCRMVRMSSSSSAQSSRMTLGDRAVTQARANQSYVGSCQPVGARDEPRCGGPVLLATNTHHWRQRPLDSRSPSNAETAEALRILRERYRTTIANTVAAFRRLSAQLAVIGSAPQVVEALRRELHRVHGAAGSFGFPEASKLAAELEEVAIRWVENPVLDIDRRAAMTAEFANALEACVLGASYTPPPEAQPEARRD